MDPFLGVLLILGFLWLTSRDWKWRFIAGIIIGIIFVVSGDKFIPDGYGPCYGALLIVGCATWLLYYNSLTKNDKQ